MACETNCNMTSVDLWFGFKKSHHEKKLAINTLSYKKPLRSERVKIDREAML